MIIANLNHLEIVEGNQTEGGYTYANTTAGAIGVLPGAQSSSFALQVPLLNLSASTGSAGALFGAVGTSSTAVAA